MLHGIREYLSRLDKPGSTNTIGKVYTMLNR